MTAPAAEDVLARHARSTACEACGDPLIKGTNQAQKRFCDDACRAAAYRRRRAGLPENYPRQNNRHGRFSLADELAGVAQQQSAGPPVQRSGFESRRPLHQFLPDLPARIPSTSKPTSQQQLSHALASPPWP